MFEVRLVAKTQLQKFLFYFLNCIYHNYTPAKLSNDLLLYLLCYVIFKFTLPIIFVYYFFIVVYTYYIYVYTKYLLTLIQISKPCVSCKNVLFFENLLKMFLLSVAYPLAKQNKIEREIHIGMLISNKLGMKTQETTVIFVCSIIFFLINRKKQQFNLK